MSRHAEESPEETQLAFDLLTDASSERPFLPSPGIDPSHRSETTAGADGLESYRLEMETMRRTLGRRFGVPLGSEVEVELNSGPTVRGILRIENPEVFLRPHSKDQPVFRVGRCTFSFAQMASVRLLQ